jgi:6-phosphogluconate dehydrogenase
MHKSNIGLIGLSVMGSNLARNIANHNFTISVYNRTKARTDEFIKEHGNSHLVPTYSYGKFVESLEFPRKIIIMVKAGKPVDDVINELLPHLKIGDIVIDAGNSFYKDTQRRYKELKTKKIQFVGMGVSGGEEGALKGPSIMPGGNREAWLAIAPILKAISAKDFSGKPCVTYIGNDASGHYVKMIHNGIEYAVMEFMAESYSLLKNVYKLASPEIADIFEIFYKGKLNSYLFEISIPVLRRKDDLTGKGYLIDHILDRAGSKGTGQWASVDALQRGISIPSITEAVFARYESAEKKDRLELAKLYSKKSYFKKVPLKSFIPLLENALYVAMISAYAQGYNLIQKTAMEEKWKINISEITRIWEGGCIIRAKLLNVLHRAYIQSNLKNSPLLAVPEIVKLMKRYSEDLQTFVGIVGGSGVSVPGFTSALFYFQNITNKETPANLIQGLRDYFGAHTYERIDREGIFHTDWFE